MKMKLIHTLALLATLATAQTGLSQMQFYGTYDSRLGDVWGVSGKSDQWWYGLGFGGMILDNAADKARDQTISSFQGRYGIKPELDEETTTYNLFAAYFLDPNNTDGGVYVGIGYSSVTIDLSSSLTIGEDTARVTVSDDVGTIDAFIGVAGGFSDGFFYDLRAGYGSASDSKLKIVSKVEGVPEFTQTVDDFSLLDKFYVSVSVGYSW